MNVLDLGIQGYEDTLREQEALLNKRILGEVQDTLIMVEHPPVVTLGRTSDQEKSIIDKSFFEKEHIPVVETRRGGKITYHAPGQLVLYPVIDLGGKKRDVSFFIDFLERTVAASLARLNVPAETFPEKRGVWLRDRKIAFIGIAVKKWVTYHGVAVNINNDIKPFEFMNPCGEADIRVTSAKDYLKVPLDMAFVKEIFKDQFSKDLEEEYLKTCTSVV